MGCSSKSRRLAITLAGIGFVGWQLDDRTASQLALLGTLIRFVESGEFHLIHFGLCSGEPTGYCQNATAVSMVNGFYFAQL